MRTAIYVRELTSEKQAIVEAGLRSKDVFRLRRSQIIAAKGAQGAGAGDCTGLKVGRGTVRDAIQRSMPKGLRTGTPVDAVTP